MQKLGRAALGLQVTILLLGTSMAMSKDANRSFDAKAFQSFSDEDLQPKKQKAAAMPHEIPKSNQALFEGDQDTSVQKAQNRINSINTILKSEKRTEQVMLLRSTRGISYFRLSQADIRAKRKRDADAYYRMAQQDFDYLAKIPSTNVKQRAYATYLQGVIKADLGDMKNAEALLRQAIDRDPTADYAIRTALFLADTAYAQKRYDDAIAYYKRFLNRMGPAEKVKTFYNVGWIYVAAERPRDAERVFLALVKANPKEVGALRHESLNELANLMSQLRSDSAIAATINKLNMSQTEKVEFLNNTITDQMSSDADRLSPILFDQLMTLEIRPLERVRLRLMQLRHMRLGRAGAPATDYDKKFADFRHEMDNLSKSDRQKVMGELGKEIQHESEVYIGKLAESYVVKTKATKEPPRTVEAIRAVYLVLRSQIEFFDGTFRTKNRPSLFRLWLDICASQEEWQCTLDVAKKIDSNPDLASMKSTAAVERLTAYEELAKKDEAHYHMPLVQALEDYIKNPAAENWLTAAKRLSAFYVADKIYDKAIPVLKSIDMKEKTEDSYYHLQLARFEAGKFADVTADQRSIQIERDIDLRREAFLRIALTAADDKKAADGKVDPKASPAPEAAALSPERFAQYEKAIMSFLALNKDAKKRLAVLHDYFMRLEKRNDEAKLRAELLKLDLATRFDPAIQEFPRHLIDTFLAEGEFAKVVTFIGKPAPGVPADLEFTRSLAVIAGGAKPTHEQLEAMSPEQTSYILGIVTLTMPQFLEDYVRKLPNPDRRQRELVYLALKLKSCDDAFEPSPKDIKVLGDVIPADLLPQPLSPAEKAIDAIKFPKPKKLTAAATAEMMKALDTVRDARKMVSDELPHNGPRLDLRLLQKAVNVERSAASMLDNAPLPPDLPDEQREEYSAGVTKMSSEFSGQADEFQKALQGLEDQVQHAKDKDKVPVQKVADMAKWPWPTSNALAPLRTGLNAGWGLAALLVTLDTIRTREKLPDSDYWPARAGILMTKVPCQSMVEYSYNELVAAKQDKLIQIWEKL